jgi:hypothetical protein
MMTARLVGVMVLFLMTTHSIAGKLEIGIPEAPLDRTVMVGRYYSGLCLGGSITLVLKRNGNFVAESHGCTGKSGETSGVWSLSNTHIVLTPKKEKGLIERLSNTFEVRRDKGRLFLVRADDGDGHGKSLLFEKSEQR